LVVGQHGSEVEVALGSEAEEFEVPLGPGVLLSAEVGPEVQEIADTLPFSVVVRVGSSPDKLARAETSNRRRLSLYW
jgi:hypothetical protein